MRTIVGRLLALAYSAREDRGFRRLEAGRFESLEDMGIWIRYGMDHEQFDSFQETCRTQAVTRYVRYLDFVAFVSGIELPTKDTLSDWYYWTAFYAAVVRRVIKRKCSGRTRPR